VNRPRSGSRVALDGIRDSVDSTSDSERSLVVTLPLVATTRVFAQDVNPDSESIAITYLLILLSE